MTTRRSRRRARTARLLAHVAVMKQTLAHVLRVNPPPPDSPEQRIRNIETLLEGPLFRRWDEDAKAQFLTDVRLALTALLRTPVRKTRSHAGATTAMVTKRMMTDRSPERKGLASPPQTVPRRLEGQQWS